MTVAVLGEYEFGEALPDPLIYLGLGVGVGAGVIVRGRLFLGAEGFLLGRSGIRSCRLKGRSAHAGGAGARKP